VLFDGQLVAISEIAVIGNHDWTWRPFLHTCAVVIRGDFGVACDAAGCLAARRAASKGEI
jgi:hypothetical protein